MGLWSCWHAHFQNNWIIHPWAQKLILCLPPQSPAMFIGPKVNSESSVPVLIGWNVTPFSHGIYRLAENVSLLIWLMGVERCSASKSNKKSVRNKKTYSSKEDTSKIQKNEKKNITTFQEMCLHEREKYIADIFAYLSSVISFSWWSHICLNMFSFVVVFHICDQSLGEYVFLVLCCLFSSAVLHFFR